MVSGQSSTHDPVPWKVADVARATGLVVAGFLGTLSALRLWNGGSGVEDPSFLPLFVGALNGLMLVAVWVFGVNKYHARWWALGLRRSRVRLGFALPWLALAASLAFAGVYFAVVRSTGLDLLLPPPLPADVLGQGLTRSMNMLVLVLWGPFAEEVFFRGFLLAALVAPLGAIRAAAVSSALFAAGHFALGAMIPVFVSGMLLSWLYLKTRSIWPPITAHAAQNLIAVSIAA